MGAGRPNIRYVDMAAARRPWAGAIDMRPWGGRKVSRNRMLVLMTYGTVCHLCGEAGADTADHIVPLSLGGDPWDIAQQRPAHRRCNSSRGNRYTPSKNTHTQTDNKSFFEPTGPGKPRHLPFFSPVRSENSG